MEHFLLTRFNLRLWPHNKKGKSTQTEEWLRHRCNLFEKYTLSSVKNQSCKNFIWVLLMDQDSPSWLHERCHLWKEQCPQIVTIPVHPKESRQFAAVFQLVVCKLQKSTSSRCITTYLDNDDAISYNFVEDVQRRLSSAPSRSVLTYTHGIQYFAELYFATRILFKHNHFLSIVEDGEKVRTIFGYGSHYFINRRKTVRVQYQNPDTPMWMEVVHEENVDNDVWMTWDTRCVTHNPLPYFSVQDTYTSHPVVIFIFRFIPRAVRVFFVHVKHKVFGHDWWK